MTLNFFNKLFSVSFKPRGFFVYLFDAFIEKPLNYCKFLRLCVHKERKITYKKYFRILQDIIPVDLISNHTHFSQISSASKFCSKDKNCVSYFRLKTKMMFFLMLRDDLDNLTCRNSLNSIAIIQSIFRNTSNHR